MTTPNDTDVPAANRRTGDAADRDRDRSNDRSTATTRRTFVRATGAGLGGLALGGAAGTGTAAATTRGGIPTPRLHTDGRWLKDPNGNRVRLRGFATASLDFVAYDWYPFTVREVLARATDWERWHPTVVRLPCEWEGINEHGGVEAFVEEILRPAVDYLRARNVYAMIDFHLIRPYTDRATEEYNADNDEDLEPIDDVMTAFWSVVAPEFADDEHVLFELFNEPTYPLGPWGEYGEDVTREESWLLWRDQAQPWVDLVREHAPATPIVIGSPNWTSETQFAPEHPFEGENLLYASHIYPANGDPDEFDEEYGAPAEEVPVVCTEFGWDPDGDEIDRGTTSEWGEPVREWMESYENVSWTAWCFDDTWAPTFFESPGQGVGQPWGLKDDPEQQGEYVRSWLEELRDDSVPESALGDAEPPTPPADLEVTHVGETVAEVTWTEATDPGDAALSHYEVFLDGERRSVVVPSDDFAAELDGLEPDSTYEVTVVAVDTADTESEPASATVETIPYGSAQSPYGGPHEIPGPVRAEHFDEGGQGIAYYDTSGENAGGAARTDEFVDVDVAEGEDGDGSYYVSHVDAGEWLEYTIDVAESGSYDLWVNVANGTNDHPDPALSIHVDREEVASQGVWPTNGWEEFTEIRVGEIDLEAGEHILRLRAESGGWNVESFAIGTDGIPDVDPEPEPEPDPEPPRLGDYEPQDTTGDGLYNDFDGDERTTHDDVTAFFEHIDDDAVQNNPEYFDFDGDGAIGFGDLVDLLRRV